MAKKRLVLLNAIFSRPDSLLLEPFQVLVRARRTRVGSDAPFTLAGPFPPLEQTVVAMETILHCDSVEEEEGGGGGATSHGHVQRFQRSHAGEH